MKSITHTPFSELVNPLIQGMKNKWPDSEFIDIPQGSLKFSIEYDKGIVISLSDYEYGIVFSIQKYRELKPLDKYQIYQSNSEGFGAYHSQEYDTFFCSIKLIDGDYYLIRMTDREVHLGYWGESSLRHVINYLESIALCFDQIERWEIEYSNWRPIWKK